MISSDNFILGLVGLVGLVGFFRLGTVSSGIDNDSGHRDGRSLVLLC